MSADTTWPPGLTRAVRLADVEEKAPDVVLRSEVDVGPAKLRRRFTGDRRTFSVGLDLRRTELATFDSFFLNTTLGGALSFSWTLPRTGATADFRFLGPPAYRPQAPRGDGTEWWRVIFEVETLPGTDSSIPPIPGGENPPGGEAGVYAYAGPDSEEEDPTAFEEESPVVPWIIFEAISAPPTFLPEIYTGFGARPLDAELTAEEEAAISDGPVAVVPDVGNNPDISEGGGPGVGSS